MDAITGAWFPAQDKFYRCSLGEIPPGQGLTGGGIKLGVGQKRISQIKTKRISSQRRRSIKPRPMGVVGDVGLFSSKKPVGISAEFSEFFGGKDV